MEAIDLCITVSQILFDADCAEDYLEKPQNGYRFDEGVDSIKLEAGKLYPFSIKWMEHHGGEGKGDDYWDVYKITDNDSGEIYYVKFQGVYSSWDGTDWYENPYYVLPRERTIVEYVEKK